MPNNNNDREYRSMPVFEYETLPGKSLKGKLENSKASKDPYNISLSAEFNSLIEDSLKYSIAIEDNLKNKIQKNLETLNDYDLQIKNIFELSTKSQIETKKDLELLKMKILEILNFKKFQEYLIKGDLYIEKRQWDNARSCYDNALSLTTSNKEEVSLKIKDLVKIQSLEMVKEWILNVKSYLSNGNNGTFNRIIDSGYIVNLSHLSDDDLETLRVLYKSSNSQRKISLISSLVENKTLNENIKLGFI